MNNIKISIITSLYNSSKYLAGFLDNFLNISNLYDVELVIVHNEPTPEELEIINKFSYKIPNFNYNTVERESIYASWNRAIKLSKGEYLAMWSVDDRREVESLKRQSMLLDNDSDCMVVTGNYYKVFSYGETKGYLKKDKVEYSLLNSMPKFNNGCFLMWRKSVHDKIGFFDEQFQIAGDWEFWLRITSNFKAQSTNTTLGYYLRQENEGISKKKGSNNVENQIIKLRYYSYFIINVYTFLIINNIYLKKIKSFGTYNNIDKNNKLLIIKCIPSLFLFWVPSFKKKIVAILYKLRSRTNKSAILLF